MEVNIESIHSQSDTGSTPEVIYFKGKTIVQDILSRLPDTSLIERYGTSMEYGTEREYSAYLHRKYFKLKHELLKVFHSTDDMISCDDLKEFFSLYEKQTNVHLTPIYIERFYEDLFIDVNVKKSL